MESQATMESLESYSSPFPPLPASTPTTAVLLPFTPSVLLILVLVSRKPLLLLSISLLQRIYHLIGGAVHL